MQSSETRPVRGPKEYLWLVLSGFLMGSADVVPGVSGGTMAFILGIYEELLAAIHAVDMDFIRLVLTFQIREAFSRFPWKFVLAVVTGIFAAIFTLAQGLSWALDNHPTLVWGFFFGLVAASIITVSQRVRRWTLKTLLATALAALALYAVIGLVPAETPNAAWFLFLSGAIVICGMILPGISGAFLLVLLGKYQYVLDAVVTNDFFTLILVIAGAGVGVLSFARVLRWLFRNHHDITVAALIGLMIGSLRKIWPWKLTLTTTLDRHGAIIPLTQANIFPGSIHEVAVVAGLVIAGLILVLVIEHFAPDSQDF